MESIEETVWDVVLAGTGLSQSLLALALSHSGKKILHVDKNDYYGGAEAALSLQEVEAWVEKVNDASQASAFRNAILTKSSDDNEKPGLGFSRAYSISLSPQLIYTRSNLLPALVSSKVHSQLEFLAVGSWWIFSNEDGHDEIADQPGKLRRIPGGREDIFSDKSIDPRSARSLMKFLKIAADAETHRTILEEWGSKPFPEYLTSQFNIPQALQAPLLALTSSPDSSAATLTSFALPRINHHLTSIGLFGPGFGSVLPKWGGLSEIAQVGCRAGAVGGGIYILNKGIESAEDSTSSSTEIGKDEGTKPLKIKLLGGEHIKAHWLIGSPEDLPQSLSQYETIQTSHSITIVSSALSSFFHLPAEGAPPPAASVVVFPSGSLSIEGLDEASSLPPVYLAIHSSDTGECPVGQSIIYASTSLPNPHASLLLTHATNTLLSSISTPPPTTLWTLHYTRLNHVPPSIPGNNPATTNIPEQRDSHIILFPSLSPGLALEDSVLRDVKDVWVRINGGDDGGFMLFEERDGVGEGEGEGEGDEDEQGEVGEGIEKVEEEAE